MSSLWTQIADANLQLFLSVVIGVATLECLVALWATTATVHWFWRALAVWAAVMLMLPIRAWELFWIFALAPVFVIAIAQAGRRMGLQIGSQPLSGRPAGRRWNYSLGDLLLVI